MVLADTNKAMVLPKVASPHLNIVNPAPGMMVYDTTKNNWLCSMVLFGVSGNLKILELNKLALIDNL